MTKCVILAGGLGTRLSEETINKPKPMVEIGGKPILWHIMQHYSFYGIKEFIICLGYKGYQIKEFFLNFNLYNSDITIDIKKNKLLSKKENLPDWKVSLIDTGLETMTGGRILRLREILKSEKNFFLTYGDGLSNVNLNSLMKHHLTQKKIATVTVVTPPGRFGSIKISGKSVTSFQEKLDNINSLINGGFLVLNNKIFKYLEDDTTIFEQEPLVNLTKNNQLSAFYHNKFWHAVDTLRDKNYLNKLWYDGKPPWKIWK